MKNIVFVFLLCLSTFGMAHAQQNVVDTLVKKFNEYREHAYQEKIYAHLDKNFYLTGETLWFKLYVVDGTLHKPSDMSKVAYVEILDRANFAVLQAKIELKNGLGNGSFFMPASLSSGNYKFRVYTSWMKNFPTEFYYSQVISVVNPFVVPEPTKTEVVSPCHVDFFPEGGHLVAGIRSKVGFKVSGSNGRSSNCKGIIIDNNGDIIATFSPMNAGLGHFYLTPSLEKRYKAIIVDPSGKHIEYAIPEIQPAGYVMEVLDSGEYLRVAVRSKGIGENNVYLFAHARQIIASAQNTSLRNNGASFGIRKGDLPEGITHLTLFDHNLQPVSERLYFKYPRKDLQIRVSTNQKIFSPRRRVTVSLLTSNENGPASSNLSLSVYKVDSLSTMKPMTINPYLWLGSDLTGTVESPEYYFDGHGSERAAAMDDLMLTHGWRRFEWKKILDKPGDFTFLPELGEHIVSAIVTKDEQKTRGVFTQLGSPGKIIRAYGSWSNEKGEVRFEIKDFYGPRRIILQTKTDSTENHGIKIQDPFSPFKTSEMLPLLKLNEKSREALEARSIAMQVQDVYYYEEYGERIIPPVVDSSAFFGQADATYLLDDYTRFPVMEEVMREYVPGVFVRKRKDGFHFMVVDQVYGGVLRGDPMVLVDGVPVADVDDVMRMDPLRVKKLEVVKRPYYLGQSVFFGIVSYTTYQGDLGGLELDPRSVTLNYDGLQLQRRFHSPQYSRDQQGNRMPDQRYLLHWEPEIKTDNEGKHQLEFYTSDVPGEYLITVEGLNNAGSSGTATYTFTVTPADNQ